MLSRKFGAFVAAPLWIVSTGPALAQDRAASIVEPTVLDRTLSGFVEDGRAVGVSALVFEDGEEAYFGAFGEADREAEEAMSRDTIVQIFSMTKPVVGVALMTLYEEGRFSLDDPIATYVPELANLKVMTGSGEDGEPILADPARQPTVRDAMRHTMGFGDGWTDGPIGEMWRELDPASLELTLAEGAERMGRIPLATEPGSEWRYGPAVDIQALMIERLSGQRLGDYLRETIFDPLGMDETGYFVPEAMRDRFATVYARRDDGAFTPAEGDLQGAANFERWARNPGSWGLASTLDDYARFARMLLGGGELDGVRILRDDTVRLMATDHLGPSVTERHFLPSKGQLGFGLDVAVRRDPPDNAEENAGAVGEFFWDGYLSTLFWVDPANDLTAVFFTQTLPFDGTLHHDIRDAVYRNKAAVED